MTTPREIIFEDEARQKLKKGIEKLVDLVSITYGPKGHNIGVQLIFKSPKITRDGSHISKEIEVNDPYLNMGLSIAKDVATRMEEACGDGITTALLLLRSLVQTGIKTIQAGASPIQIKKGMEKACEHVVKELNALGSPIKKEEDLRKIATVAAGGDEKIGHLISEALFFSEHTGRISIEEGKSTETQIEIIEGMELKEGYSSSYFCTDFQKQTAEMLYPKILISEKKIYSIQEILETLQTLAMIGHELVLIVKDIEPDVLATLIMNKLQGTLKICVIKIPGSGQEQQDLLEDVAIFTGATLISEKLGVGFKNLSLDMLGEAEKIMISKEKTLIMKGKGDPRKIQERLEQLEKQMEQSCDVLEKEVLEKRRLKLLGGITTIQLGAYSETELKEKKLLFEESLNSTLSAQEDGIVPGGGISLLHASKSLLELKVPEEEFCGVNVVLKACETPFRQLVENSGHDSSLVFEEVCRQGFPYGFNINTETVENLEEAGIFDPLKTVKNALLYAVSAAGTLLLSEILIGQVSDEQEKL